MANADALFPNNDCARETAEFADKSAAVAAAENDSAQQIAAPKTWNCMTTFSQERAMQRSAVTSIVADRGWQQVPVANLAQSMDVQ
ncbi:hypothetical protein [Xanthomonas bromi]|uniref:hypothetical protein n=1 Tax=Xanthomonas bromi TaxID=56449 RepID=UPI001FD7F17B|nr:hypothetical protein [Xanthomonas bromi]